MALFLVVACTVEHRPPEVPEPSCAGDVAMLGDEVVAECGASGRRCENGGCVGCIGGTLRCVDDTIERCDGGEWSVSSTCSDAETCVGGGCENACTVAERERSYLGCDYDAISTLNSLLQSGFDFGVVIGNPGDTAANVRVSLGGLELASKTIAPRSSDHFALDRVLALTSTREQSSLVPDGAFRIESDRPIAAYQYNPLEFRRSPECRYTGTTADIGCFSFTNDASLLLPRAALGTEHLLSGRASESGIGASFVAISAREPTRLHVLSFASLAGSSTPPSLPPRPAGVPFDIDLAAGDVLQLVAHEGSLAGTTVESDRPVLVITGSDCANVPARFGACDHLEEIALPLESWGSRAIAAAPRTVDGEPSLLNVLSGSDGNTITITGLERPIELDRGDDFEMVVMDDVIVEGSGPILVTQYLVGAQYFARDASGALGDPAMGIVPFAEQFRTGYGFTVPSTYVENFAAVVAEGDVLLDGEPLEGFAPIADSSYRVVRIPIASGAHTLDAPDGAGLTLYGLAPYTSYLLPGGLDVERLR